MLGSFARAPSHGQAPVRFGSFSVVCPKSFKVLESGPQRVKLSDGSVVSASVEVESRATDELKDGIAHTIGAWRKKHPSRVRRIHSPIGQGWRFYYSLPFGPAPKELHYHCLWIARGRILEMSAIAEVGDRKSVVHMLDLMASSLSASGEAKPSRKG